MQQHWLGLRPEDLSDADRTLLTRDRKLSAVHRAELNFGMHLENLPFLGRVNVLDDVKNYAERMGPFAEPRRDRTWLFGLPLVLIVLGMLGVMAFSNKPAHDPRAVGSFTNKAPPVSTIKGEPTAVSMSVWAGQTTGSRPVMDGMAVQRIEGLVLELHAQGSGHAVVGNAQTGERIFPLDGKVFFIEDGTYRVGRDYAEIFRFSNDSDAIQLRTYFCQSPLEGFPLATPRGCQSTDFQLHYFDE